MKASRPLQYKSVLICNPRTRYIDKPNNLDPSVRTGGLFAKSKLQLEAPSQREQYSKECRVTLEIREHLENTTRT